jgi:hypothetical protein
MTRPSWRSIVGSTHWLKQAKTIIISGMGGGSLCVAADQQFATSWLFPTFGDAGQLRPTFRQRENTVGF